MLSLAAAFRCCTNCTAGNPVSKLLVERIERKRPAAFDSKACLQSRVRTTTVASSPTEGNAREKRRRNPDGATTAPRLIVVQNWFEELKRLVARK